MRAEQKAVSKQVGSAAPEERPAIFAQAKELAARVKDAEAGQAAAEKAFTSAHMAIANVVIDGVPPAARTTSSCWIPSANPPEWTTPGTIWNWARRWA